MLGKLRRLPAATRAVLKRLACLGSSAPIATLTLVQGGSEDALHAALWPAVRARLLLRQEGAYRFLHDRVREAAYALIPEGERAAAHLAIGRRLAAHTPPDAVEESVFEIVGQLNRGAALISVAQGARAARRAEPDCGPARQILDRLFLGADLPHRRRLAVAGRRVETAPRSRFRARAQSGRMRVPHRRAGGSGSAPRRIGGAAPPATPSWRPSPGCRSTCS